MPITPAETELLQTYEPSNIPPSVITLARFILGGLTGETDDLGPYTYTTDPNTIREVVDAAATEFYPGHHPDDLTKAIQLAAKYRHSSHLIRE